MKLLFSLFVTILFFGIGEAIGQNLIIKNDTIPINNDSIVTLVLPQYRGLIYWQQSFDNEHWITSTLKSDSLKIPLFFKASYRACVTDGTCSPFYSEIVKIIVADSVKNAFADTILVHTMPDSLVESYSIIADLDTFPCIKINEDYIYQGDVKLNIEDSLSFYELKGAGLKTTYLQSSCNGFFGSLWSDGIIYYKINENFDNPKRIEDAINYWRENTILKFEVRTDQNNYVEFINGNMNSSSMGMLGKNQIITIVKSRKIGPILHEIGHTVGLMHEHVRKDRDDHIKIMYDNITDLTRSQFYVPTYNFYQNDPFDFESIMMYASKTDDTNFALNPSKPIMTDMFGFEFDTQYSYLSSGDIEMVKKLYLPTVSTVELIEISSTSVSLAGNVTYEGAAAVTERGICWGKYSNYLI